MTKEEYFFKDIPPIKEQAYMKYHVAPWLNGETKEEFIRKSESMTDEELERFDLDYENCHNRCIYNPLYQIFVHHNDSWDKGKYSLIVRAINPFEPSADEFKKNESDYDEYKKKKITEGLIKTVPAKIVYRHLTKNYNLDDIYSPNWLHNIMYAGCGCVADIVEYFPLSPKMIGVLPGLDYNIETIFVKIPDIERNREMLIKAMSFYGYSLSEENAAANVNQKADAPWKILTFIPDFQEYVTERIIKENDYLFHISPARFKEKILKRGLCPQSKNSKYNYPPRIYMSQHMRFANQTGTTHVFTKKTGEELALALHSVKPDNEKKWTEYIIYRIDISKLKENIRFSYDDDFFPLGIFTADNINPEALEIWDEIDIKNLNDSHKL